VGRVREVPPGEPARSTAPIRGRTRVSPAAATARSLRRRRDALIPVHVCYIALCANLRLFRFLSHYTTKSLIEKKAWWDAVVG